VETRSSPTVDYDAYDDADWLAYQGNYDRPIFDRTPYSAIMAAADGSIGAFNSSRRGPTVRVTARWGGYEMPPADIVEACIMQSARWYKRLQSSMSDTLASADMGTLLYQKSSTLLSSASWSTGGTSTAWYSGYDRYAGGDPGLERDAG